MASSVIGSLRAVLGIDTAQFTQGLAESQTKLSAFGRTAQTAGLAAAAALTGAAVAIGAAVKQSIDHADEMSKTAQKIGVAVDQLSRLAYAGKLADVSLETLSTGVRKLSVNMTEVATSGTGKAAAAFKRLGVSVTDSSGHLRAAQDVMNDVADRFGHMQDGAVKTADAMAIFGKSGAELIPLLNDGKQALQAAEAEADQLGLTLDEKTGKAAERFNDNLTRLKSVGQGIVTQITAGLLPGLAAFSDSIVAGAKNTQFMHEVVVTLSGSLKLLASAGVILGAVFDATFKTIAAVVGAVAKIVHGDFAAAWKQLTTPTIDSFVGIGDRLKKIWSESGDSAKAAGDKAEKQAAPAFERAGGRIKKAVDEQAKTLKAANAELDHYLENIRREQLTAGLSANQVKIMDAQAQALEALRLGRDGDANAIAAYAAHLIELDGIQRQSIDTSVKFERTAEDLQTAWTKGNKSIGESFDHVLDSVTRLFAALKNGDWGQALSGLSGSLKGLGGSIGAGLTSFLGRAGVGLTAGQALGLGSGNAKLDLGLGLGGAALGTALAGSSFAGVLGAGAANLAVGLGAGAGLAGGIGTALMSASVLGPIAVVAALALGTLLKSKPSNNAAIAAFSGDSYTIQGNKKTAETSQAATAAADAVLQGISGLKGFGIALTNGVRAIDIGTRDMTHIYLTSGQELRTAIGDPAAAAETALHALLEGATFTSDAQKSLVQSMLAAGQGFDAILVALQGFAAAQGIGQQITDAILQIADPKAFEVSQLGRQQKTRRDGLQAALDAGYITADAFAALSAQLTRLEGLELDQVLAKYVVAVETAVTSTVDLGRAQQDLADAVTRAQDDLKTAYDAQAGALKDTVNKFSSLSTSLHAFGDTLTTQAASGTPQGALAAARAAFEAIAGRTDADSLGKLQGVSQAYIDAARTGAGSPLELARIQAQVRNAVAAGAKAADAQVSLAQQQLNALDRLAEQLGLLNQGVLSLPQALANLMGARAAAGQANPVLKDTAGRVVIDRDAGIGVDALGNPMPWAIQALGGGARFATGGGFRVGGFGGTDSKLAQMALTPGEYVNVTHGDSMRSMASELGALRSEMGGLRAAAERTARAADDQHVLLRRVTRDGDSLLTKAA